MKVTILIPTLDEEEGIGPTLDAVDRDAFAANGWDLELLIIDGDSKDRTREEAEARGARVVVDHRKGYGRAYKTGFAEATGDIIVTGDADATYPFDQVNDFVARLLDGGHDFLTMDRYALIEPGAMSPKHRLGNWVLSCTLQGLFWVRIRDSQSGMWIIRRSALDAIPYESLADGMAFSQEIKIEAMKRHSVDALEIPGTLRPRRGEAKIDTWGDGFGNLKALYRRRLRGRSERD